MIIKLVLKLNKKYSEIAVDLEKSQLLFYCSYGQSVQMLERRREKVLGVSAYAFMMSNPYIMGLYCECEVARAGIAVDTEVTESDPVYKKVMGLFNVNEVLFQCLILDDIWEYDGMICAKLYTIYTIN